MVSDLSKIFKISVISLNRKQEELWPLAYEYKILSENGFMAIFIEIMLSFLQNDKFCLQKVVI